MEGSMNIDPAEAELFEVGQIQEFQRLSAQTHPDLVAPARARLQALHDHFAQHAAEPHEETPDSIKKIKNTGVVAGLSLIAVSYVMKQPIGMWAGAYVGFRALRLTERLPTQDDTELARSLVISRYLLQLDQSTSQKNE